MLVAVAVVRVVVVLMLPLHATDKQTHDGETSTHTRNKTPQELTTPKACASEGWYAASWDGH